MSEPQRRGRRGLYAPAALLAGLALACSGEPRERVLIDLAALGFSVQEGQPVRLPRRGKDRLLQEGLGDLELYVRVPLEADFRFRIAPQNVEASFRVAIETGSGSFEPKLRRTREQEWSADLSPIAGEAARIRLSNLSDRPLEWVRPRIVGTAGAAAPTIERSAAASEAPVNVLLYVVDTLRADRLSLYGHSRPTSPRLAELATRSLVFRNAYAPGSATPPSISALMASRHPSDLAGRLDGSTRTTLAEAFQEAGHRTAAFQANLRLLGALGFARGFEVYELMEGVHDGSPRPVRAAALHARAFDWLREHREEPFFLYVQAMDVHEYDPPPGFRGRFGPAEGRGRLSPDSYDETIAYADQEIGRLLDELEALGVANRTVVAITADHGEPLGDHGTRLHGLTLYEEVVRIPLILFVPWEGVGREVDRIVSLVDLGPTLLDLATLPVPEAFEGRSLLQRLAAGQEPVAVGALTPRRGMRPIAWYLREGPWKLLFSAERLSLYHLPSDPREQHDVGSVHPVQRDYLLTELVRRSPEFRPGWRPLPRGERVLEATERARLQEALRALGYLE